MPPLPPWPHGRQELYDLGVARAAAFLRLNGLPAVPCRTVAKENWWFDACAGSLRG